MNTVMEDQNAHWCHLMAAAQQGDRRAYRTLLRAIIPVASRIVRERCPMASNAEVEDVVQETLRSLHEVRHTYMPDRPFLPWLAAVTHGTLRTHRPKLTPCVPASNPPTSPNRIRPIRRVSLSIPASEVVCTPSSQSAKLPSLAPAAAACQSISSMRRIGQQMPGSVLPGARIVASIATKQISAC